MDKKGEGRSEHLSDKDHALGLARLADQYLLAAHGTLGHFRMRLGNESSHPLFHLLGQSVELRAKSLLVASGYADFSKLGHNLAELHKKCAALTGCEELVSLDKEALKSLAVFHAKHVGRYGAVDRKTGTPFEFELGGFDTYKPIANTYLSLACSKTGHEVSW
ncbi:hypothetical protein [Algicella marina]|uniref:HEPN domain-containing protein n=1 Tax=Algicella marina TaxID=2683284 RepID=A0A6P1T1M4_9RHOB|nr:hypothetical protein [Algicella marina]QHQ35887.1 hypothetical protein GO499_12235 [Algicella marina]